VPAPHLTMVQLSSIQRGYGTVGNCPAVSCASRAALSPASWVAFSLEWNVPLLAGAVGVVAAAVVVTVGVDVAAWPMT
jgi:hypothetical protein